MPVFPVAGSDRFDSLDKSTEELVISETLPLYEADPDTEVDPITYEVVSHKLIQINDELAATIRKVSGSVVVNEAYDFNVAMGDERGDLFTIGAYISVHATTLQQIIQWTLENRSQNPGIEEGDMFLVNDPWVGAAHQNDVSVLGPIFVDGKLFSWSACTLHQVDVGGINPGSFCVDADDVFSEGMPTPPVKLVSNGELRQDVEDAFLRRSRVPPIVALDIRAMIAANNVARARMIDLIEAYGPDVVHTVIKRILDSTEYQFRQRLKQLPDGEWKHVHLYEVSMTGDRGVHKVITTMKKEGDRLLFDATETDPQAGYFNATKSMFRAGIMTAVFPLLCPDLPWAPGALLRVIEFEQRPGTIASAEFPAAVSGGTTTGGWVGINSGTILISKMLDAGPEDLRRNLCSISNAAWLLMILQGIGKDGNPVITVSLDQASGGLGARAWRDGDDTGGMILSPGCQIANVETQEWYYPILYLYRKETRDSGGPGRYRGGVAGELAMIPYDTPQPLYSVCSAFSVAVPNGDGLSGGLPAKTGFYKLVRNSDVGQWFTDGDIPADIDQLSGDVEWPPPKLGALAIGLEDVYSCGWNGGGGYGDPLERDGDAIADDVDKGYVSPEQAQSVYGAVFAGDGSIDYEATEKRRGQLRGARVGKDSLPRPQDSVLPDDWQRFDGNLGIASDGTVTCLRCHHGLTGIRDNYKDATVVLETKLTDVGRVWMDPGTYVDEDVLLRQFVCPGCGTLLENEVALRELDPVPDKQLVLTQGVSQVT